jgi:hypothetical protein
VKHGTEARLFPDAELGKDAIEKILDIDPTGDAPERTDREAHVLGQQLRVGDFRGAVKRRQGVLQSGAMTGPR